MGEEHNVIGSLPYNQLLALSTAAKGDEPMDKTIKPMSAKDQKWLQAALQDQTIDVDPVRKLQRLLTELNIILSNLSCSSSSFQNNYADNKQFKQLQKIVEEDLIDLVCDLDMAFDFCKLGGLQIVQKFLNETNKPCVSALFLLLISELGQNNPRVQEFLVREDFISICLRIIAVKDNVQSTTDESLRYKALGALSAIVKGYIPGIVKFVRLDGPKILKKSFEKALQDDESKIVYRCSVVTKAICRSFSIKLAEDMKVADLFVYIQSKLESIPGIKYQESLDFLRN